MICHLLTFPTLLYTTLLFAIPASFFFFFFFCFKCSIAPPSQSLVICHHPIRCILFFLEPKLILGLPRWFIGKEFAHQFRGCRLDPLVGKIPWRRNRQPTPVLLPGEIPSTKEPGRLQSMGLQRARHNQTRTNSFYLQSSGDDLFSQRYFSKYNSDFPFSLIPLISV